MKTTTKTKTRTLSLTPSTAPFKRGALILRKGEQIALRFSHVNEGGNVFAVGSKHDEQPADTLHDLGADLSRIVEIPEAVTMPNGATLKTRDLAALAVLVRSAERHFRASAKAWEDRNNDAKLPPAYAAHLEKREQIEAEKGAALLAPLGISCDWPGLYPSFTVHGYSEHSTESAVLSAVGLPRNALRGELGARR